jgi:chaperonin GroES
MRMKVKPLFDRVLVKRINTEEKTRGGLYLPESAKEKPAEGKVIAVGDGKRAEDGSIIKMDVKKGDRVLFGKYSGNEIKIAEEEHIILREDEILAILE